MLFNKKCKCFWRWSCFDSDDLCFKTGSLRVEVKKGISTKRCLQKQLLMLMITAISKDSKVDKGIFNYKWCGTSIPIDTTGKTYSDLVTEINKIDGVQASL